MSAPPPRRVTQALLAVLRYMVEHDGRGHAYAIMSDSDNRSGSVGALLRRLHACGWTTTSLEPSPGGGGVRVVHTLTDIGLNGARRILADRTPQTGDSRAA